MEILSCVINSVSWTMGIALILYFLTAIAGTAFLYSHKSMWNADFTKEMKGVWFKVLYFLYCPFYFLARFIGCRK